MSMNKGIMLTRHQERLLRIIKERVMSEMIWDPEFAEFIIQNASGKSTAIRVLNEWLAHEVTRDFQNLKNKK
jgi:hypothetical protein